jgi:hypothetical protein
MWRARVSTAAVILLCALGVATLFVPWAHATVMYFDPEQKPGPDGRAYPGYRFWHAIAAAGGFLGVFLFLVVTGRLDPAPWWRWGAVLAAGGGIIGAVLAGMNSPHGVLESDMAGGRAVAARLEIGNFLALGLASALMLLAAVELSRAFGHRRRV